MHLSCPQDGTDGSPHVKQVMLRVTCPSLPNEFHRNLIGTFIFQDLMQHLMQPLHHSTTLTDHLDINGSWLTSL